MRIIGSFQGRQYVYCRGKHVLLEGEQECMTGFLYPLPPAPVKHWFSPVEDKDPCVWSPKSRSTVTKALQSLTKDYRSIAVRASNEPCGFIQLQPHLLGIRLGLE